MRAARRYHGSVPDSTAFARSVAGSVVSIAVAIVIIAAAVVPFLSPAGSASSRTASEPQR